MIGSIVGSGQQPAAEHAVAVRLAGDGARRAALGPRLGLTAGRGGLLHLLGPRHRGHRRVEGAAGERGARPHHAAHRDRHVLGQLLHREVGAEVVRDRVEAAGVDDAGAGVLGGGVVGDVHPVDELGLAGEVDVVGAGLGARRDQRLAVLQVGADGRDHDAGPADGVLERDVVGHVGDQEGQVGERGVDRGQVLADALELGLVAPGQGPAQACGRVPGEVLGGQAAGEAGRAEQDEVELPVRAGRIRHGHIVTVAGSLRPVRSPGDPAASYGGDGAGERGVGSAPCAATSVR